MDYRLINGDCIEVMSKIADNCINTIICDLPYGTTKAKWDDIIPMEKMWEQYNRILKDNGTIILFGTQPFTSKLIFSNIENYRYSWIWDKVKPVGHLVVKKRPMQQTEDICVFKKASSAVSNYYPITVKHDNPRKTAEYGRSSLVGGNANSDERICEIKYPRNILTFSNGSNKDRIHPTQKPLALLEYLVLTYSLENDIILDNCSGSNSTGVASIKNGRRFIGIEKDKNFYIKGKKRMEVFVDNS